MAKHRTYHGAFCSVSSFGLVLLTGLAMSFSASAYQSKDGTLTSHGFLDYTQHVRANFGMVKNRVRAQLETTKEFGSFGIFRGVSLNSVLRVTHDGVYEWNDDDFGEKSGGSVFGSSSGVPNNTALGALTPWGQSPVNQANIPAFPAPGGLPGNSNFTFDLAANPNEGLKRLGMELGHRANKGEFGGGLEFFTPTRPCNVDPRGCIKDYMDADESDLRNPEFTSEHRWLRELYLDATLPFSNGDELNFRIGRQNHQLADQSICSVS